MSFQIDPYSLIALYYLVVKLLEVVFRTVKEKNAGSIFSLVMLQPCKFKRTLSVIFMPADFMLDEKMFACVMVVQSL